jgi:hypothetical protein
MILFINILLCETFWRKQLMSSEFVRHVVHVASHHVKHKFIHSAQNHTLGTGIGVVAGIGLGVAAAPLVGGAAAVSTVAAIGCGILGGEVEKIVKKH